MLIMDENPYLAPQSDCPASPPQSRKPYKSNPFEFLALALLMATTSLFQISYYWTSALCFVATLGCISLGRVQHGRSQKLLSS
jgi:hypothetical protein